MFSITLLEARRSNTALAKETMDSLEEKGNDVEISRETFVVDDYDKINIDPDADEYSGHQLVDYVNRRQDLWGAKWNELVKNISGNVARNSVEAKKYQSSTRLLPKKFDSRQYWPECSSIQTISSHGMHNFSWAFTATSIMADRLCIASKGEIQVVLSPVDLEACCQKCDGGNPYAAWKFFVQQGLVTAGKSGCLPFSFGKKNNESSISSSTCVQECQGGYKKSYNSDKFYGKFSYSVANNVEAIQKELMAHGPIQVTLEVYEDLIYYKYGIYFHNAGKFMLEHSVKLIGWGEDDGIPYWLISNSWGKKWGEAGVLKILRGVNECNIEASAVAGIPRVSDDLEQEPLSPEETEEFFKQIPTFCRTEAFAEINWEEQVIPDSKWDVYYQQDQDNCYAAAAVALTIHELGVSILGGTTDRPRRDRFLKLCMVKKEENCQFFP